MTEEITPVRDIVHQQEMNAKAAPPVTWDTWEQLCVKKLPSRFHPEAEVIHNAAKAGIAMVFNWLKAEFPPHATCQASGKLLEACKACDTGIVDFIGVNEPTSKDFVKLVAIRAEARIAIAKAEPKG